MLPSALARQLRHGLAEFLRASFRTATPELSPLVSNLIDTPGGVTKGPFVEVKLPFAKGSNPSWFPGVPLGFTPHAHQERAFARLDATMGHEPRHTIVATGTGSGKTECFLVPILAHCLEQAETRGIKAIIIYPMNALATDQAGRIARMIHENTALNREQGANVRVGLYIGASGDGRRWVGEAQMGARHVITDRETLQRDPPDILLTNYKMLDYLLVRPSDQGIWRASFGGSGHGGAVLRYLVVDELHTFDGAQGTDLACLLRRLQARLGVGTGHPNPAPCCIGTSATLGGAGGRAASELLAYAEQVFGVPFEGDAIVGETREGAEEFLAQRPVSHGEEPDLSDLLALDAAAAAHPDDWLRAQIDLWFGEAAADIQNAGLGDERDSADAWRVALGAALLEHAALHALLRALDGRLRSADELVHTLGRTRSRWREGRAGARLGALALDSLLALVAAARSPDGRPLLEVRVQLWQRELKRMVASVSQRPVLRYVDDLEREERRRYLPIVYCRDCAAMGWATKVEPDKPHRFRCDHTALYRAFFDRDPRVAFLFPVSTLVGRQRAWAATSFKVDPAELTRLEARDDAEATAPPPDPAPVELVELTRRTSGERGPRLSRDCPLCGAQESMTLLGSQAASLTSVYVDQLFASPFNGDKRLLAFSDNVQDAAHRAGFLAARTWRTNLRIALRRALLAGADGLTLADLSAFVAQHWRERLGDDPSWLAAFLAPGMAWWRDWEVLRAAPERPPTAHLVRAVERRLDYEIGLELTLSSGDARSLPASLGAALWIDRERLAAARDALLEPLRNEVGGLRDLDAASLERFLLGLLHRMRRNGAVLLAELPDDYVASGGGDVHSFSRSQHLPRYAKGSRLPVLLADRPTERFDTWLGRRQGEAGWYARWAERLGDTALSGGPAAIYPLVTAALERAGLLAGRELRKGGRVWGVAPGALRATADVARARCSGCGDAVTVARVEAPAWRELPCLGHGCDGVYAWDEATSESYLARLYGQGDLQRIYAAEHTGLLDRQTRERVEREFKADPADPDPAERRRPWFPNLLSCTPTLEMGIDIGDLSSAVLCSVPPQQASYLQRIGRAGRRDGNAFVLTVAAGRPHDTYFYAQPEEMMAGAVATPGVFLDAAAVLERQLAAWCFDRWAAEEGERAELPGRLGDVFEAMGRSRRVRERRRGAEGGAARGRFPDALCRYVETREGALLSGFLKLFGGRLGEDTVAHLRGVLSGTDDGAGGLAWRLLDLLEGELRLRDGHLSEARRLDKLIRDAEAAPQDKATQDALEDLRAARDAAQSLARAVEARQVLELLTDRGFLPNYAFPEAAVRLTSLIYPQRSQAPAGHRPKPLTFEYTRAPASALSELAPEALFYAGGRRVRIERVDLSASSIERWRFCSACNHAARVDVVDEAKHCPSCGDEAWGDPAQCHRLVPLRQVYAATSDRDSRIRDDRDEREPRWFQKEMLVSVRHEDLGGAWFLDRANAPFGYEYLRRATFREVNFGRSSETGEASTIAGRREVRPGFTLCERCGTVQRPNDERKHTLACPTRSAGAPESLVDCLYLYRQMESEAIRMLLPMSELGAARSLSSFVAALQLGLTRHFGGRVDHLRTTVYSEPVKDSALRKQYLVLYDTVPGGTGYIKQLVTAPGAPEPSDGADPAQAPAARPLPPLFEVLARAKAVIEGCECYHDTARHGCYRCLYGYRNAGDMDDVRSDAAIDVLDQILSRATELAPIASLSQVSISGLADSELEHRFLEALRHARWRGAELRVRNQVVEGRPGFRVEVGEQAWTVTQQVLIGRAEGVGRDLEADFVFRLAGAGAEARAPIAVFLDGWEFHADRVGRDLLDRQLLLATGRYDVWSLTWRDLDEVLFANGAREPVRELLPVSPELIAAALARASGNLAAHRDVLDADPFALFVDELGRGAAPRPWRALGRALIAAQLAVPADAQAEASAWSHAVDRVPTTLRPALAVADVARAMPLGAAVDALPHAQVRAVLDSTKKARLLARLSPGQPGSDAGDPLRRRAWWATLRLFQLLRHAPEAWFYAEDAKHADDDGWRLLVEQRLGSPPASPAAATAGTLAPTAASWALAADLDVEAEFRPLCERLAREGVGRPEVGADLPGPNGRSAEPAELVWREARVAVVDGAEALASAEASVASGWRLFERERLEEGGDPALAELLAALAGARASAEPPDPAADARGAGEGGE